MVLPQITLSKKLLLLLMLPTAVQLGIIGGLAALNLNCQIEADKAERARQVHDSIGKLVKDRMRIIAACEAKNLVALGLNSSLFQDEQSSTYQQFALLKTLLKNNPHDLAVVQGAERSSLQSMAILQQLKEMNEQGDITSRVELKPLLVRLRRLTQDIVSSDLIDVSNRASEYLDRAPTLQRRLHQQQTWLIIVGGLFTLALSSLLAFFLVNKVGRRLERMADSSENLSRHTPILAPENFKDNDEIAVIDKALYEMSRTITEITAKQMAVVDNAQDMVCSLDEDGKIISANVAAGKLFGGHQADLIGKSYRDIVYRQDISILSNHLELARAGSPGKPVKLRLIGRGRRTLWVIWSVQWSAAENQYFSVVQNLTQIKEAQRMKQEIIAIITKDLRSPLANLQEFIDLLEEGSIARMEERGQKFLLSAKRNADQMMLLIDDMIDLEKAKNGMLTVNNASVDLDDVIDQAQIIVGPFAEEKGVVLDCRRGGLKIKGEEDKLRRVFINLLGHAVQQAPRDTSVLLISKGQDSLAQVSISDKGRGLSSEQISTIFDAFNQSENIDSDSKANATNGQAHGSGLGLAISKAFVELHGGKISAASKKGDGTTIALTLPLA